MPAHAPRCACASCANRLSAPASAGLFLLGVAAVPAFVAIIYVLERVQ